MSTVAVRTIAIVFLILSMLLAATSTAWAVHDDVWDEYPDHDTIVWDLDDDGVMYKVPHGSLSGSVVISSGNTYVWKADEAASGSISFPSALWYGYLDGTGSARVWIGSVDASDTFTPSSAGEYDDVYLNTFPIFAIDKASSFTVPNGEWLALKVEAIGAASLTINTTGESGVVYPKDNPAYPVPEITAGILLGLGVLGLGGYLFVRRRKLTART